MTEFEVRVRLNTAINAAGGQRQFAQAHGFSVAYVNDVVRGKRDLAARILAAIGIERRVVYEVTYQEKSKIDSQIDSFANEKAPGADVPKAS